MLLRFVVTSFRESWNRKAYEDGTPFNFNGKYMARRFVGQQNEETTRYITQHLKAMCQETLGSVLEYPVFEGKGLHNKAIIMLYPKDDQQYQQPCAFNVAFHWELLENDQKHDGCTGTPTIIPCIHYGLFIVTPKHQKRGLQGPMGFLNLFLLRKRLGGNHRTVWMTDMGRSPSGSRHFAHFMSDVYPNLSSVKSISNSKKKEEQEQEKQGFYHIQRLIAHEFHQRFQKEAGMAYTSRLEGRHNVVKGSNGKEGGAAALVKVNATTHSRHQQWNDWMQELCPDPEDEVIMVGHFSVTDCLFRELTALFPNHNKKWNSWAIFVMLFVAATIGAGGLLFLLLQSSF